MSQTYLLPILLAVLLPRSPLCPRLAVPLLPSRRNRRWGGDTSLRPSLLTIPLLRICLLVVPPLTVTRLLAIPLLLPHPLCINALLSLDGGLCDGCLLAGGVACVPGWLLLLGGVLLLGLLVTPGSRRGLIGLPTVGPLLRVELQAGWHGTRQSVLFEEC